MQKIDNLGQSLATCMINLVPLQIASLLTKEVFVHLHSRLLILCLWPFGGWIPIFSKRSLWVIGNTMASRHSPAPRVPVRCWPSWSLFFGSFPRTWLGNFIFKVSISELCVYFKRGNKIFICPNDSSLFLSLITPLLNAKKIFHPVRNPQAVPLVAPEFALAIARVQATCQPPTTMFLLIQAIFKPSIRQKSTQAMVHYYQQNKPTSLIKTSSISFVNIQSLHSKGWFTNPI